MRPTCPNFEPVWSKFGMVDGLAQQNMESLVRLESQQLSPLFSDLADRPNQSPVWSGAPNRVLKKFNHIAWP